MTTSERGFELATEETYHLYARRDRADEYQHELLAFCLGTEEYALDILRIAEIIKMRPITEVPRAPQFIPGIISVRGQVVPIVDLRLRLRRPPAAPTKDSRILIVTREGEPFGLIVDAVRHVVRLRDEELEATPPTIGGVEAEFIRAIGRPRRDRLLILLQLDAVLAFSGGKK